MSNTADLRTDDREREVWIASRVADALNNRENLDLYAERGGAEPADAVLFSRSDSRLRIRVQVVSTPGQPHIRSDYKNLRKLEFTVMQELRACGIGTGHFSISWTDDAVRHRVKHDVIRKLAQLIRLHLPGETGYFTLCSEDEYDENPWIVEVTNLVHGLRNPGLTHLTVSSRTGCWLPLDGRWIADAVARKIKQYGRCGCSGVTLIVDGGSYVDREQTAAFAALFNAPACPFEHLWVVALGSVRQIK
jgi:hypothetical protein